MTVSATYIRPVSLANIGHADGAEFIANGKVYQEDLSTILGLRCHKSKLRNDFTTNEIRDIYTLVGATIRNARRKGGNITMSAAECDFGSSDIRAVTCGVNASHGMLIELQSGAEILRNSPLATDTNIIVTNDGVVEITFKNNVGEVVSISASKACLGNPATVLKTILQHYRLH